MSKAVSKDIAVKLTSSGLGQLLLTFWDGVTPESDALLRIQDTGLGDQALDSPHASIHHVNSDIADLEKEHG